MSVLNYAYWHNGHGIEIDSAYYIHERKTTEDVFSIFEKVNIWNIKRINYTISESKVSNLILNNFFKGLVQNSEIVLCPISSLNLLFRAYGKAAYVVGKNINVIVNKNKKIIKNIPYSYVVDGNISHINSIDVEKLYLLVDNWRHYEQI